MNMGVNSIIATVCRQQNANMQSHMRGYDLGEEFYAGQATPQQEEFDRLNRNFRRFARWINRFLYGDFFGSKCTNFSDWVNQYQLFNADDLVKYFEIINDKILDDPRFSQVLTGEKDNYIMNLGSYYRIIDSNKGTLFSFPNGNSCKAHTFIAFIPSVNDNMPNIIRLGITEEYSHGNEFVNGYIDICSNGEIVIGDFDRIIYKFKEDPNGPYGWAVDKDGHPIYECEERNATIEDSAIDVNSIDSIKNYIMNIFEQANLLTNSANIRR